MRGVALVAVVSASLALLGCSRNQYQPPELPLDSVATIVGSDGVPPQGAHPRVFGIDGKVLPVEAHQVRNEPARIAPGVHRLEIVIWDNPRKKFGSGYVNLEAEPGAAYVVRAEDTAAVSNICDQGAVWIERQSGEAVTDKVPIGLKSMNAGRGSEYMIGGIFVMVPARKVPCP